MKNKRTIPKPDGWQFNKLFSVDVKHLCPECLKVGDYESHWDRDVYNKKGLLLGTRTGTSVQIERISLSYNPNQ